MSLYEFVKNFPVCYILFIIKNINKIKIKIKIIKLMVSKRRIGRRSKKRRNLGENF